MRNIFTRHTRAHIKRMAEIVCHASMVCLQPLKSFAAHVLRAFSSAFGILTILWSNQHTEEKRRWKKVLVLL